MNRLTWMDLVLEITETLPKEQYIVFGGRLYYFRYIDFSNEVGGNNWKVKEVILYCLFGTQNRKSGYIFQELMCRMDALLQCLAILQTLL